MNLEKAIGGEGSRITLLGDGSRINRICTDDFSLDASSLIILR